MNVVLLTKEDVGPRLERSEDSGLHMINCATDKTDVRERCLRSDKFLQVPFHPSQKPRCETLAPIMDQSTHVESSYQLSKAICSYMSVHRRADRSNEGVKVAAVNDRFGV